MSAARRGFALAAGVYLLALAVLALVVGCAATSKTVEEGAVKVWIVPPAVYAAAGDEAPAWVAPKAAEELEDPGAATVGALAGAGLLPGIWVFVNVYQSEETAQEARTAAEVRGAVALPGGSAGVEGDKEGGGGGD